jgi:hypothetical protein
MEREGTFEARGAEGLCAVRAVALAPAGELKGLAAPWAEQEGTRVAAASGEAEEALGVGALLGAAGECAGARLALAAGVAALRIQAGEARRWVVGDCGEGFSVVVVLEGV